MPIWVTLRDFAQDVPEDEKGTAAHLFGHIERVLKRWKLEEAYPALQDAIEQGSALILLDGLDEVPPTKRAFVREAVNDFTARCHTASRIIITCRILSYTNPDWQIPHMVSQTIAPFDEGKIAHFVQAWYTALQALRDIDAETAQKRVADLSEGLNHPHLHDIAANPMLLTVMAVVHNHTGTLPRESARLYDECVKLLMLRWRPHDARDLIEDLDVREDDLYRMLWEIAYDAHNQQADREGAADISEGDVIFSARKRLGDLAKAEQFCKYVEERAGLLIGRGENARGERVFTFPHRTFQEYLAGCQLASERFSRRALEHACKGAGWREALLLATGHLIYNSKDIATPLDAIDRLCSDRFQPQNDDDWRLVWLAGDMLQLVGAANAEKDEVGREVLPRIREKLVNLIEGAHLPPVERAAAGRVLGLLGDPRPGVGVLFSPSLSSERGSGGEVKGSGDEVPNILWCEIPAGSFLMGSHPAKDKRARDNETPQYEATTGQYRIAKYLLTYAQFEPFVNGDGYTNPDYWTEAGWTWKREKNSPYYWNDPQWHILNHPVIGVTWYECYAYCRWLTARLHEHDLLPEDWEVRLPTESEWEKAARGENGLIFPYGDEGDTAKGNHAETGIGRTSAVGLFSDGVSPYGVLDISGNVWEWLLTKWRASYAEAEDNNPVGDDTRGLRGGSWSDLLHDARAASRRRLNPRNRYINLGFRVCASPISTAH